MTSSTDEQLSGRVVAVEESRNGSRLTAAAAISDTVLSVAETGDFDETGGQVLVAGDLYDYGNVDEDASTITIDPPLSVASAVDDPVDIFDPAVGTIVVEYVALVLLDDQDPDDEPLEVSVQHALAHLLEEKIRGGAAETVTLIPDGDDDFMIYQVDGKIAENLVVDEAVADAGDAIEQAEAALTAAQLAQAILDGEIAYYYVSAAPWADGSAAHDDDLGDVWVDTDSIPQQAYRWLNRTWTLINDGSLVAALFAAQDAQTTADGKITHFIGPTTPTAEGYGDIWTNTAQDNRKYYWDGDSWEALLVGDDAIVSEIIGKVITGATLRTAASGQRVVIDSSNTAKFYNPSGSAVGQIYGSSGLQIEESSGAYVRLGTYHGNEVTIGGSLATSVINGFGGSLAIGSNVSIAGALDMGGAIDMNVHSITDILNLQVGTTGTITFNPLNGTGGSSFVMVGNGGVLARGAVSSLRHKENLEALADEVDLTKLYDVDTITWQYTDREFHGDRRYAGVPAEQLHELGLGIFVDYDDEGRPDQVRYWELTAPLLALVQQQAEQIAALSARLDALEAAQ